MLNLHATILNCVYKTVLNDVARNPSEAPSRLTLANSAPSLVACSTLYAK